MSLLLAQSRRQRRGASRAKRDSGRTVTVAARAGLVARSLFYCMLVYLVVQLAVDGGGGQQANAHGALATIASNIAGRIVIAVTAAGYAALGAARIVAAIRDRRSKPRQRLTTFLRGVFYVAVTWIPASYAIGKDSAGSEQQHRRAAGDILSLPAGRELLFAVGLVVIGVCIGQIWTGVEQEYQKGLDTKSAPRWVARTVELSGTIGYPARGVVFFPLGIFFMIAAVRSDPGRADGLDGELAALARHSWGTMLLALVAVGLAVFALYSFLDAIYRQVAETD